MHAGPSDTPLSFKELVAAAQKVNSSQLDLLFAQSNDPQFLMKFSAKYPAAKQRLIDNLGKWEANEKTVLVHLSKSGYVQATSELLKLGGYQPGYEENRNLAKHDQKYAVLLYAQSYTKSGHVHLCVKDWVEIAKENLEIANHLITDLYRFLVNPKKRSGRNPFGQGDYWPDNNSYLYEGLFALLGHHPSLATEIFQDEFKLYNPKDRNIEFHRLCNTQAIFLNLVFQHATCFSVEAVFQLAKKYSTTFIQYADNILALPKFQGTPGQGLNELAESIRAVMKVIEEAPKVEAEAPTLTAAFDRLKISEAQGNTLTSSDKKLIRRASC